MFGTSIGLILEIHPTGISALEELGFPCKHGWFLSDISAPRETPLEMPPESGSNVRLTDIAMEVELGL